MLALALFAVDAAAAQGGVYVALGDSYTSAPLVPNQYGEPIDCGRSDRNYPALVAEAIGPATFVDVSCGSAQTKHMSAPQTGRPAGGTNPPQFDALRRDATLVSVGIGGNDAGLVGVAETCVKLGLTNPTGTACRDHYAPGGRDTVAARIDETAPKIAAVLQGIRQRSPGARIMIVGYPDVLPKNGASCYPMVPLSPDDIRYIDELLVRINAMIAREAAANGADYVDTYADSGGHDVCTLPPERWFEGVTPTEPAFPLHPNGKGEASMARSVLARLSRPAARPPGAGSGTSRPVVTGPVLSALRASPVRIGFGRPVTFRYRLDRAARVKISLRRALPGRVSETRCVAPSRADREARRCRRSSRVIFSVTSSGGPSVNRLRLGGHRWRRRAGLYRITATPRLRSCDGRALSNDIAAAYAKAR